MLTSFGPQFIETGPDGSAVTTVDLVRPVGGGAVERYSAVLSISPDGEASVWPQTSPSVTQDPALGPFLAEPRPPLLAGEDFQPVSNLVVGRSGSILMKSAEQSYAFIDPVASDADIVNPRYDAQGNTAQILVSIDGELFTESLWDDGSLDAIVGLSPDHGTLLLAYERSVGVESRWVLIERNGAGAFEVVFGPAFEDAIDADIVGFYGMMVSDDRIAVVDVGVRSQTTGRFSGQSVYLDLGSGRAGDLDGNRVVDVFDLIAFLTAFDPTGQTCEPRGPARGPCNLADIEEDSDNDVFDLIAMLRALAG